MNISKSACWISNKLVNSCHLKLIKVIKDMLWLTDGIIPIPVYWRDYWGVLSGLNFNQPLGSIEALDCIVTLEQTVSIPILDRLFFCYWHSNDTIYPLPCSNTVVKFEDAQAGMSESMNIGSREASGFHLWEFSFEKQPEIGIYFQREGPLWNIRK